MNKDDVMFWLTPKFWVAAFIGVFAFFLLVFNINIIESGEVGIKKVSGKYDPTPMDAGIYWTPPWVTVEVVDAHQHAINYIVSKWDNKELLEHDMKDGVITVRSISATDSRGLPIDVDITVRYQINKDIIPQTIAKYGRGWEEMLVNPNVRDAVREVIAQYPAEEIPTKRAEIGVRIEKSLGDKITKIKDKPLFFAGSNLREVRLPKRINDNITEVQESRQRAEQAKQNTILAKQEALRKAEEAKGEAEKRRIEADAAAYVRTAKAKAEAEAIKVKAEAQASANKLLAESLTPQLVTLKDIEARAILYRNPSLKIVPENSNMLFGDILKIHK
jgi:regulator of protease activity HflC (stomatin/prohibitin superfamily)